LNQQRREARSESDVTSVGQSASGKEDALELTTDREPNQQMDSLLRQAMNNDRGALDELFAHYRGRLYNTLLRLLGNPDDAEEVLQDGMLARLAFFCNLKRRLASKRCEYGSRTTQSAGEGRTEAADP
jgi:hypothetical protein